MVYNFSTGRMRLNTLTILLIILLPILIFFFTRGVITHDEGYILNSSQKFLSGQMPYRDYHFVYSPGSIFLTALSFALLGVSVISSRILMLIIALLSIALVYAIILKATRNKLYGIIATLLFAAWGPTHINFSWPVMFAIFAGLLTSFLLMKFLETRHERYLFFSGLSAFLILLAKQNFGIIFVIPILVFFLVKSSRQFKYFSTFSMGYMWGIIGFVIYLLYTSSFGAFISDFYFFTVKRILINDALTTHFIYPDFLIPMVLRTGFYLLLPFISIATLILLYIRRRFHLLFIPTFILAYYIVGIRPTTDYNHLVPLLSLIGIPLVLFLRFNIYTTLRIFILLVSAILILTGFQTGLFKGYYRWDTPLVEHNYYLSESRLHIFTNEKFYIEFKEMISTTEKYTNDNDYIFVNSYNPLLYFITKRQEPVKNNYLTVEIDPKEYYAEVVGNLVAKKIKIIYLDHNSLKNLPIKKFIESNYYFLKTIQDFDVYILKS